MTNNNTKKPTLEDFVSVLPSSNTVKETGNWTLTNCVAHEDNNPSLIMRQGDTAVIVKCLAGCDKSDVLDYFYKKLR